MFQMLTPVATHSLMAASLYYRQKRPNLKRRAQQVSYLLHGRQVKENRLSGPFQAGLVLVGACSVV